MAVEVTDEELREAQGKYGAVTFKLGDEEYQAKLLGIKKHLNEKKGIDTYADVVRELIDSYLKYNPSWNF